MPHTAATRLLIVEDDPDTASLMLEVLEDHFGDACAKHCACLARALQEDAGELDLVLTDMNLPDGSGMQLLEQFRRRRPDLPVVMVTGTGTVDTATTAIARGAYDYVVKAGDYLLTIPLVVEKNLAVWRTRQDNHRLHHELQQTLEQVRVKNEQLEQAVAELQRVAATDPLTGLANRRAFGQALERRFAEAKRHDYELSCLMMDMDAFKQVNDTLGHQAGDDLLKAAAQVLAANCRRSDVAGRFGGDELVLLLPQTGESQAKQVAARVERDFERAATAALERMGVCVGPPVMMSVGVASTRPTPAETPEQLVAAADHALYRVKVGRRRGASVRRTATAG